MRDIAQPETLALRIRRARFELAARTREKVSQERLGTLVGERLGRPQPITGATVSRWESGDTEPDLAALGAIAAVCKVDPGWLAFGEQSAAPAPWDAVPLSHLAFHHRRVLYEELNEERAELLRQASEYDRARRTQLMAELRAANELNTRESRRRAHEIIREMDQGGQVERLLRTFSSRGEDDAEHKDDYESDEAFEERMARYEAEEEEHDAGGKGS